MHAIDSRFTITCRDPRCPVRSPIIFLGDFPVEPNASAQTRRWNGWLFLAAGLLLGVGIAALWPQRPLTAATSDRNEKFGMCTVVMTDGLAALLVVALLTRSSDGS